ncbi:AzlD domain-containing protein [Cereibacter sp. SYSU M97828]|nr:AzlD domain-containing protein [Cereibacter flavus]
MKLWIIILGLGVGTYLLRLSFLAFAGGRQFPEWALRHLRYTAVAVLPALIAPGVLWPAATGGQPDPARLAAAAATIAVAVWTRNTLWAIGAGAAVLYTTLALIG